MNRRTFLQILGATGAVVVAPIAFNAASSETAPIEELQRFPIIIDSIDIYDPANVYTYFDGTKAIRDSGSQYLSVTWRDQAPCTTDNERVRFIAKDHRTGETVAEFSGVVTNLDADMEDVTTYTATLEDVYVIG